MIAAPLNATQTYYDYDPWGKRVWKEVPPNGSAQTPLCEFYFYGLGGQKLETFNCTYAVRYYYSNGSYLPEVLPGPYAPAGINLNFGVGGKLLQSKGVWVVTDRLGSVRANSNGEQMSYFPYGEERTSTANDREKYGTYMRDGIGQDYADQRYYNSNNGAFWNPDPGGIATANPRKPSSWNRYMYGLGDPVNKFDPSGREACNSDEQDGCDDQDPDPDEVDAGGDITADVIVVVTNPVTVTAVFETVSTTTATITTALDTVLTTVVDTAIETILAPIAILGALTATSAGGATDTLGLNPTTGTFSSAVNTVFNPDWVEANCTAVGPPVIVPSTQRGNRGGTSEEQE